MQLKFNIHDFSSFHGELTPDQRDKAQASYFANDVDGLVLTVEPGDIDLNFVAANIIILVSPPWNPQRDAQVMDRTYRIDQLRNVKIYHILILPMELRTG